MRFFNLRDLYLLLVIALIKVTSWSPSPRLKNLVVIGIASAAYRFSRKKRHQMEKNLSKGLGTTLSREQRQRIIAKAFHEQWMNIFSIRLSKGDIAALRGVKIEGVNHLQRALDNGKGAILWESQFGLRTLAPRILHEHGFSLHQVHAENHLWGLSGRSHSPSWVIDHVIIRTLERWEEQFVEQTIYLPRSDSLAFTRVLLKRLKDNGIICVTGDGKSGRKLVPLRLLGWTDFFSTGMVSLAKTSGAPILPMFCFKDGSDRANLIIESPITIDPSVDRERSLENSLAQYVSLLESYIRRYPEKYLHWRFPEEKRGAQLSGRIDRG